MTVKPILTEPNKLLRQISKSVEKVTKEEKNNGRYVRFNVCSKWDRFSGNSNWYSKKNNCNGY